MNKCDNFKNGICLLASKLCGEDVQTDERTCDQCGGSNVQNKQTVCLSTYHLSIIKKNKLKAIQLWNEMSIKIDLVSKGDIKQFGIVSEANKERLSKIKLSNGVGSNIWRILESISIKHNENCPCLDWAERLNDWGPNLCRENKEQIVKHFKVSSKNYGWGDLAKAIAKAIKTGLVFKLSILDPFGSLLDEAIRLTIEQTKNDLIDIIIPLGPGSKYNNNEIKIALRSIEKNAVGYRKIFIIGHIPSFLVANERLVLVKLKEFKCNKESRISEKVAWAFKNLDTTDRIAFWNDDYVLLQRTDVRLIKNCHKGKLYRRKNKGYNKYLNATHNHLKSIGLTAINFDSHIPIIYEKEKFLSLHDQWEKSKKGIGFVAKSIYGNNFCIHDNTRVADIKLGHKWQARIVRILDAKVWLISYGDAALNNGFLEWLLSAFPEKSSFEK